MKWAEPWFILNAFSPNVILNLLLFWKNEDWIFKTRELICFDLFILSRRKQKENFWLISGHISFHVFSLIWVRAYLSSSTYTANLRLSSTDFDARRKFRMRSRTYVRLSRKPNVPQSQTRDSYLILKLFSLADYVAPQNSSHPASFIVKYAISLA